MNRYDIALGKPPPEPEPIPEPVAEEKTPEDPVKVSEETQQEREELIRELLRTSEGRQRLAASMANPMRQRLDIESIGRRIFRVEPLLPGALPVYEKGLDATAYAIGGDGDTVMPMGPRNGFEDRFTVPEFEIISHSSIPITRLQSRRYTLIDRIDRAQDVAVQEIKTRELILALRVLDAISNEGIPVHDHLTFNDMALAISSIEGNDFRAANAFMNPIDFVPLRQNGGNALDIETNRTLLNQGIVATLWGTQINVSRYIPAGQVYLTAEPQYTGVIPIRRDVEVISQDNPANRMIGWSIFELIGICCFNPSAVARIHILR